MISLHRRQVDTLPTRRWWQNTGGLKSVCISRVTFCRSISGSNIFSLGLMCVFLPKWQMGVRNPPPRAQTPPPPPLLCHRGLPSVLWVAFPRLCSHPAWRLAQTWWTFASPLRTRGQPDLVAFGESRTGTLEPLCVFWLFLATGRSQSEQRPPSRRTSRLRGPVQTPLAAWDRPLCSGTLWSEWGRTARERSPQRRLCCWLSAGQADRSAGLGARSPWQVTWAFLLLFL